LRERAFDIIIVGNKGHVTAIAGPHSLVVMVYHGIGLKQSYYRDHSPRIDLRVIESEERFQELQRQGETNLVLCGFTKLDPLFNQPPPERAEWLTDHGLDPERKTVLYAPTFYPSSLEQLLPVFPQQAREVNLIIKLHHFSWHLKKYRHQVRLAQAIAIRHPRCFLSPPEEYNILPLYQVSDVLISDISSTLYEFLAVNRPIIQTEFSTRRFKHRLFPQLLARRLDVRRREQIDFTQRLRQPEQLRDVLAPVLEHPDTLEKERVKAAERYLYQLDGQASRRLVDAIEARLQD
jgi:CDP-glycerol glycerophosphotransferase (TagB/SpsB family)